MRRAVALVAISALAVLAACGSGDAGETTASASDADRTIEVQMRDIAFAPTAIDVRTGEKVRFVFTNTGQVTHDAFIGDEAAQEAHEKEMRGGHDHGKASNEVSVDPGKTRELTYTFDKPGRILIGCHQPGHYTGGMKADVNIA